MESISVTHPIPPVVHPPALSGAIENSPEEKRQELEVEKLRELLQIRRQKEAKEIASAEAATAGGRLLWPRTRPFPAIGNIVDLLA